MVLNTAVYYTVYRRRSSERLYRASLYDCVNFRLHAAVYFIHVLNIACCFVRRVSYVSDSVGRACVEILCSQLGGGLWRFGGLYSLLPTPVLYSACSAKNQKKAQYHYVVSFAC